MDIDLTTRQTNFFEKEVAEYQKGGLEPG